MTCLPSTQKDTFRDECTLDMYFLVDSGGLCPRQVEKHQGLVGAAFQERKPLLIVDAYQDERFFRGVRWDPRRGSVRTSVWRRVH